MARHKRIRVTISCKEVSSIRAMLLPRDHGVQRTDSYNMTIPVELAYENKSFSAPRVSLLTRDQGQSQTAQVESGVESQGEQM